MPHCIHPPSPPGLGVILRDEDFAGLGHRLLRLGVRSGGWHHLCPNPGQMLPSWFREEAVNRGPTVSLCEASRGAALPFEWYLERLLDPLAITRTSSLEPGLPWGHPASPNGTSTEARDLCLPRRYPSQVLTNSVLGSSEPAPTSGPAHPSGPPGDTGRRRAWATPGSLPYGTLLWDECLCSPKFIY